MLHADRDTLIDLSPVQDVTVATGNRHRSTIGFAAN
jgi:hypothetical protein